MIAKKYLSALIVALSFFSPAVAQSVSVDSGHYYEGLPYNYINTAPRAGTFYYNDFNRYEMNYFNTAQALTRDRYFGSAGGSGNDRDYNGAAIIGQNRGMNGTFSGALTTTALRRTTTGSATYLMHTNNPFDRGSTVDVSGAGLPAGHSHAVSTLGSDNSVEFRGEGYAAEKAQFAISTVGFENIQLSFDMGVGFESTAHYAFMASADGGLTWSYTQNFYNLNSGQWYEGAEGVGPFFNFTDHPEFANNPSFVFQLIAIQNQDGLWENTSGAKSASRTGGDAWIAQIRLNIDRLTLSGDAVSAVPEPATYAAITALVVLGLALRQRRRRA